VHQDYIEDWSDYQSDLASAIQPDESELPLPIREMTARWFAEGLHGGIDGIELKEWVRGATGNFWLAKAAVTGAGDIGQPLHEAVLPRLYAAIGLRANEVALGFRHFAPRPGPLQVPAGALPTSYHRYHSAVTRDLFGPIAPEARFYEDYAAMAILDLIVGNADRHVQNYMVDSSAQLFVIDSGRSLAGGFLPLTLQPQALNELARTGGREGQPWPAEFFTNLATRFQGLLTVVDLAFASLPRSWRRLHDLASVAARGDYQASSWEEKVITIRRNTAVALAWLAQGPYTS